MHISYSILQLENHSEQVISTWQSCDRGLPFPAIQLVSSASAFAFSLANAAPKTLLLAGSGPAALLASGELKSANVCHQTGSLCVFWCLLFWSVLRCLLLDVAWVCWVQEAQEFACRHEVQCHQSDPIAGKLSGHRTGSAGFSDNFGDLGDFGRRSGLAAWAGGASARSLWVAPKLASAPPKHG